MSQHSDNSEPKDTKPLTWDEWLDGRVLDILYPLYRKEIRAHTALRKLKELLNGN